MTKAIRYFEPLATPALERKSKRHNLKFIMTDDGQIGVFNTRGIIIAKDADAGGALQKALDTLTIADVKF